MELSDMQTKKLLEYPGRMQIKQLGLNMALTRLRWVYQSNPTPETVSRCARTLNLLFQKYAGIMRADYEWIISL